MADSLPCQPCEGATAWIDVPALAKHAWVAHGIEVAETYEKYHYDPEAQPMPNKCGQCGKPGHNVRTCKEAKADPPKARIAPPLRSDTATHIPGDIAKQIRALVQRVADGEAAKRELAEIRKALA